MSKESDAERKKRFDEIAKQFQESLCHDLPNSWHDDVLAGIEILALVERLSQRNADLERNLDCARSYMDCQLQPEEPGCGDCVTCLRAENAKLRTELDESIRALDELRAKLAAAKP